MWILNSEQTALYDTRSDQRITICDKENAVLIIKGAHCIGRYCSFSEAQDVLLELARALDHDQAYFEMPRSAAMDAQVTVKDARVKRKGGS
jgi:hypothetical protein